MENSLLKDSVNSYSIEQKPKITFKVYDFDMNDKKRITLLSSETSF